MDKGIEIVDFFWFKGHAVCETKDSSSGDISGIRIDEPERIDSLPPEFFTRELIEVFGGIHRSMKDGKLACDAKAPECLVSFISKWGIPYSPVRYFISEKADGNASDDIEFMTRLERYGLDDQIEGMWLSFLFDAELSPFCISVAEAVQTIDYLVRMTAAYINAHGEIDARGWIETSSLTPAFMMVINACSRNREMMLPSGYSESLARACGEPYPSLTNAICNQFIETERDPAPWRKCLADDCGRWFKRKRGSAEYQASSTAGYCSLTCENRVRQRGYRAKHKADPRA